jgi:hypothetical protein
VIVVDSALTEGVAKLLGALPGFGNMQGYCIATILKVLPSQQRLILSRQFGEDSAGGKGE